MAASPYLSTLSVGRAEVVILLEGDMDAVYGDVEGACGREGSSLQRESNLPFERGKHIPPFVVLLECSKLGPSRNGKA